MHTLTRKTEAHLFRILGMPVRETRGQSNPETRVLMFEDQPVADAFTLITAGLADTHGQELLLCGWNALLNDATYATIFSVARLLHDEQLAVTSGMLVELPQPITSQTAIRHLLLWPPVYHDDALQTLAEEVEILWMVPLLPQEAAWLERKGATAFDEKMTGTDPDLLDWTRASVV
ncbi:MAG: suppressor of fused domain protein [Thermoanaerobaculia bacterium]